MRGGRRISRLGVALAATGTVLVFGAAPAWAHVTVIAPGVHPGASDATLTVRVPDESDRLDTTGLKLQLPTDHLIAGVLIAPQPGWTAVAKQTKLATPIKTDDGDITEAVSEIDWTASDGGGIKPGFFGEFTILAGQLPEGVSELTFKAVQQYSDGSTVSWIEEPAPGSSQEPEHPAPKLTLTGAPADATPVSVTSSGSESASKAAATTGIVLGALGTLLGAAALALVVLRRRSRSAG